MKMKVGLPAALFFGVVGVVVYLNFSGFCYSKGQYLSDEDLIHAAVQDVLNRQSRDDASHIRYDSVEQFIRQNPACCIVRRSDRGGLENVLEGRWARLFGLYVLVVDIWYQAKPVGPSNYYELSIAMTSCGNVTERTRSLNSRPRA